MNNPTEEMGQNRGIKWTTACVTHSTAASDSMTLFEVVSLFLSFQAKEEEEERERDAKCKTWCSGHTTHPQSNSVEELGLGGRRDRS